jgi:nitroreductase
MDVLPEIVARRSCRSFRKKSVEKAKLERILKAAQLSPSAKNRQEWRFVVVQKAALRKRIQDAAFGQEYVGQAPAVIAVCTTNIDYRMPNGQLSYPVDLAFAAASMVLQATREELGSCVVTTFDEQEIKDLLSIPYAMKVVLLLLVGYGEGEPSSSPRKPLKRIVSYDHW